MLASGDPVPAKLGRSCMRKLLKVDEVRQGKRYSDVFNRRVSDDVVLEMGESHMIVAIEIMHASRNLDLSQLLPVRFERVG